MNYLEQRVHDLKEEVDALKEELADLKEKFQFVCENNGFWNGT